MDEKMIRNIGPIAFVLGIIVSVLVGVTNVGEAGTYTLLILGIVVGALNIQPDEVLKYLVAIVALLLSSSELNALLIAIPGGLGPVLGNILHALTIFLSVGASIVSLKVLTELAKD